MPKHCTSVVNKAEKDFTLQQDFRKFHNITARRIGERAKVITFITPMKINLFYFFVFLLAGVLVLSCKKKANNEATITFLHPSSGDIFMPGDTIHMEVIVKDDNKLASLTIKLLNAAYTPVDHQESIPMNATTYQFTFAYVIENNYLESGNYFLTISTTDGDNDINEYLPIVINGIPKTVKAVYALTQQDSANVNLNQIDSTGQLLFQFSIQGDYSGSVINSRYNQLNIAGNYSGAYNQFDLPSYSNVFSEPAYNGTSPSFQGLTFAHALTFLSYYDGRIKAFDQEGHTQFNAAQPVYYRPAALCVNDKYVFVEAYYPGPGVTRIVVLNYPSGTAKQEYTLDIDIVSMLSRDDNDVIVFGNDGVDGKIYLYHVTSNNTNDFHTLYSNTVYSAIAIDSDRYALATSDGLYSYQVSSNNLVPVDAAVPVYSMEYNDVNGILYVNAGRKIKQYAFPDPAVLNVVTSADSILDLRVLYNK